MFPHELVYMQQVMETDKSKPRLTEPGKKLGDDVTEIENATGNMKHWRKKLRNLDTKWDQNCRSGYMSMIWMQQRHWEI
jgi:hypothetical protein